MVRTILWIVKYTYRKPLLYSMGDKNRNKYFIFIFYKKVVDMIPVIRYNSLCYEDRYV